MLSLQGALQGETANLTAALATQERLAELHSAAGRTLDKLLTRRNVAGVLMNMGEHAAAKATLDEVLAHWPPGSGDPIPPHLQVTQAMLLLRFDDLDGASEVLSALRRRPEVHAQPLLLAAIALLEARTAIGLGRLDDAERLLGEVETSPHPISARSRVITPATVRSLLLLARGDTAAASRRVEDELSRLDPQKPIDAIARASCLRAAARIALAAGDAPRAQAHATAAVAAARNLARDPTKSADVGESLLLLAQAQQELGRRREAADTAGRAAAALSAGLSASHPLARVASAIGDR
jgi:tetratricopeptide (TPR) repeat protein